MSNGTTTPIERTPNIGANLAAELRSVGIDSLEALMRVGFWDAWLQLRRANPERNSVPACLALAGAVAGVRWNHLPPKVDAATEKAEATERAKQRAYGGTEVKALEKANQLGADINKQAQDRDPDK
jgi:hypothetical protein